MLQASFKRAVLVTGLTLALLVCGAAAAAKPAPPTKAQQRRCLGMDGPGNRVAATAPADPTVISALHAFTAASAKPVALRGMSALGNFGVASYDPAHEVDIADQLQGWRLILLAVQMAPPPSMPSYCGGLAGWHAAERLSAGESGPGVCVIAVLDGNDLQGAMCESLAELDSYLGPLNLVESGFDPGAFTLLPDGVRAVRYTFASGSTKTVAVRGNLAVTPVFALPGYGAPIPNRYRLRVFRKWFPRTYPTEITLLGTPGSPDVRLPRPVGLFGELAGANRLDLDRWNLTPASQRPD